MGFASIGSIGEYTRYMKLSMKWNEKKETGAYTQKQTRVQSEHEFFQQQLDDIREDTDPGRQAVYAKLYSGKKLSSEEMEYLRENDPENYRKAKEVEAERIRTEKEMENCKTKEDVERVRTLRLSVRMAYVNSISNNPNIPESKKMELLLHENAKAKASAEVVEKFKESLAYDQLPADAEELEEEKQTVQAEKTQTEETKASEEETLPSQSIQPVSKEEEKQRVEKVDGGEEIFQTAVNAAFSYGRQNYLETRDVEKQPDRPSEQMRQLRV